MAALLGNDTNLALLARRAQEGEGEVAAHDRAERTTRFHAPTCDFRHFLEVVHPATLKEGRHLMYVGLRAKDSKSGNHDMFTDEYGARVAAAADESIPSETGWADRAMMKCGLAGTGDTFAEFCLHEALLQAHAACDAAGLVFQEVFDVHCVHGGNVHFGAAKVEQLYTNDETMEPVLAGSDPRLGPVVYSTPEGLGNVDGDVYEVYCGTAFRDPATAGRSTLSPTATVWTPDASPSSSLRFLPRLLPRLLSSDSKKSAREG